jgi:hypothetical protein
MKNKELFERTINALVQAKEAGTLKGGDPCGCAVGNLIAAHNGYTITGSMSWRDSSDKLVIPSWFCSARCGKLSTQTADLGYTGEDIKLIESAFEEYRSTHYKLVLFNGGAVEKGIPGYTEELAVEVGLRNVYAALCEIHEVAAEDLIGENPFKLKEDEQRREVSPVGECVS